MKRKRIIAVFLAFLILCVPSVIVKASEVPPHVSLDEIFTVELAGVTDNNASAVDGVVTVTDGTKSRVGSVWSTEKNLLDFTTDFTMVAYVNQNLSGLAAGSHADGMAFVIQSYNSAPTWFTSNGGALGILGETKADGKVGIPNSMAIEFDLYINNSTGESGMFDRGINAPHIATVFPGDALTYENVQLLFEKSRKLTHFNTNTSIDLHKNQWNRLELNWRVPENGAWTEGALTYTVNNGNLVTIDKGRLNSNVFQNGTVSTAYWGFTGATGPSSTAKQQVVFEQVPGLVEAEVPLNLYDNKHQLISDGAILKGGQEVTVEVAPEWLAGKQNWEDVVANLTLPDALSVLPNTTMMDETQIADNSWQGANLTTEKGIFPKLGLISNNDKQTAKLSFKATVKNEDSTNQVITSQLTGRNAIYDTQSITFGTEKQTVLAMINQPTNNQKILDDSLTELLVEVGWKDLSLGTIEQVITLTQADQTIPILSEPISSAAGEGLVSKSWLTEFNQLAYGEFALTYQVTNGLQESATDSVKLFKQNRPQLTLHELEQTNYHPGDKIPVSFSLTDKDSTSGSLWMSLNDNKMTKLAEFNELEAKAGTELEASIDTTGFEHGKYQASFYFEDDDQNKSEEVTLAEFVVEGELQFNQLPTEFSTANIKIGGEPVKATVGEVSIIDDRMNHGDWSLSVSLDQPFTMKKDEQIYQTSDNFFYYQQDGESSTIGVESPVTLITHQQASTGREVSVNQEGQNGFYFHADSSLVSGSYQATLIWTLTAAP